MVKARKIAAKGGRIAGSGAGGFLTGIFSSPAGLGAIGIITLLGIIFIFRDQIGKAIGGFGENIGKVELPDINFPDFPDFKFPDITFPTFEFPTIEFPDFNIDFPDFDFGGLGDFFGGAGEAVGEAVGGAGEAIGGAVGGAGEAAGDFFGNLQDQFNNFISGLTGGTTPQGAAVGGLSPQEIAALPDIQDDIEGLTPAQAFGFIEKGIIPTGFKVVNGQLVQEGAPLPDVFVQDLTVKSFLLDEPTQVFEGGGLSFEGGSILETPIANLSLSQIIDKFMVTASQAANIKAIAEDDFGDFDFGTNTGLGIGSVIGTIPQISGGGTNVSDPMFAGLSPEEIALQLTGGNISNF